MLNALNWQVHSPAPIAPAAFAWFGNAAKMRVIDRIAAERRQITVLDYGAGEGRAWPETLYRCPNIELVCYEPDAARAAVLRTNVPKVYGRCPSEIAERADYIVSFSVLEHVYDRAAYLAHAFRLLKSGGRMFLNYDDGHFRAPGSRIEALRNRLAPILPHIGMVRHYQARVRAGDADRLVADAGFGIIEDRYENLPDLKALAKAVPPRLRADFAGQWLDIEDRLNSAHGPELEAVMLSRTIELARTEIGIA